LNRILFASDRVGWICAGLNTILKTVDGGKTWNVVQTNLAVPGTDVAGIWFGDEDRGWAAGAVGQQPAVWQTRDGGRTWAIQQLWPRASAESLGGMLDIRFVDDAYGWAVGFNGSSAIIVGTDDGGQHWKTQFSGGEIAGQFSRVSVSDRLNLWVLSRDGAVMQTRDGGQSWQLRYFDPGLLNSIDVVDSSDVWVAGAWGHLLHSRNGVAWPQVPLSGPLADHFFGYVKFVSMDRGWAWGTKCDILMTLNGGKTWTPEACPLRSELAAEITTGEMARSSSKLFMIANPGYVLVRSIE
jgi:photosystem II stability/assembly factor-like uncharacterized protein